MTIFGDLLFLQGHITNVDLARRLAGTAEAAISGDAPADLAQRIPAPGTCPAQPGEQPAAPAGGLPCRSA